MVLSSQRQVNSLDSKTEHTNLPLLSFCLKKKRSDHLYAFFLRWSPDRSLDPLNDDEPKQLPSSPTKTTDVSTAKGFVLLANDDPELTDDYKLKQNNNNNNVNNNSSSSNSDSTANQTTSDGKKQHYLKRQNTLLKEWEVKNKHLDLSLMKHSRIENEDLMLCFLIMSNPEILA